MAASTPLLYRIAFVVLACGVVVWTFRSVGSIDSLRTETSRRFGINVSRRVATLWLTLSVVVRLGLLTYLAFYLAGRTG